jgi:hypothetical protein
MTVAERESLSLVQAHTAEAFSTLARTIIAISEVRRVDTAVDGAEMHWWIFVEDDPDDVLDRVYAAERTFNQALGRVFLRARVIPLRTVDMAALPRAETLFQR